MLLNAHPFPRWPEQLFRRRGPLVLEIGFGDGGFLCNLAREHPEWNIMGADTTRPSVERALRRLRRNRIDNVWLYRGSGVFLLRNLCPKNSLFRVYVNFPDPWPKKRHHGKRLLTPGFFALLSTRLEAEGTLHLTTDHEPYYRRAVSSAAVYFDAQPKRPPAAALRTKYATKWKALDRPLYHAELRKCGEARAAFPLSVGLTSRMHHAILSGRLPRPSAFDTLVHSFPGGRVVVLDLLCPLAGSGLVFRARIEEPDLMQDALIEARRSAEGSDRVLVGVMPFGQPLSTRGTKEAVRAVTTFLEGKGMRILDRYC